MGGGRHPDGKGGARGDGGHRISVAGDSGAHPGGQWRCQGWRRQEVVRGLGALEKKLRRR